LEQVRPIVAGTKADIDQMDRTATSSVCREYEDFIPGDKAIHTKQDA
jgi:hypothetical protein